MNKLTITANGKTVTIEQQEPISADIIVRGLKAMEESAPIPYVPVTPYNPFIPYDPFRPYIWSAGGGGLTDTTVRLNVEDMAKTRGTYTVN